MEENSKWEGSEIGHSPYFNVKPSLDMYNMALTGRVGKQGTHRANSKVRSPKDTVRRGVSLGLCFIGTISSETDS